MTDEVKNKSESTNLPAAKVQFMQPVSTSAPRVDPNKTKIAIQLIEAEGRKLIEQNFILPGMMFDLIALDVFKTVLNNPDYGADQIVDAIQDSVFHHLRGNKGVFSKLLVDLAKEEYKLAQNPEGGNYNQM